MVKRMVYPKELFDLQFTFAERVRALSGLPLERVLLDYTNFYVRFGLGRTFDPQHPAWQAYLAGLRAAHDLREWTYRFYLRNPEATTAPDLAATFGCFSYALESADRIRMHFRNAETESISPLSRARMDQRRAELTALFRHVRETAGVNIVVVGVSWLYNLDAYRRLFPPAYGLSARVARNRFRSMPLWGQFVDHRGRVRGSRAHPFLRSLAEHSSPASLDECFPLQALTVEAPVEQFYGFYGV
ncbi:MAG TPA: hypothetical protein VHI13_08245 [Candidatus Kapabacteria bacterium]|nr:hypothetical protein [Candidatus Kapabacteria bacterium]